MPCSARSLGNPTTLRNRGSSEIFFENHILFSILPLVKLEKKCHQIGHLFFDFFASGAPPEGLRAHSGGLIALGAHMPCSARSLGNPTTLRNRGSSEIFFENHILFSILPLVKLEKKCHQIGHLFFDFFASGAPPEGLRAHSGGLIALGAICLAQQEVSVIRRLCEIEAHPRYFSKIIFYFQFCP